MSLARRGHRTLLARGIRIVVLLGLVFTAATYLGDLDWRLERFCHFRLQYAAGLAGLAPLAWWALGRWWGLATLAAALANVAYLAPYLPPSGAQAHAGLPRLRLLSCNVYVANATPRRVVDLIEREDPDVVVLLEPLQSWEERLRPITSRYPAVAMDLRDDCFGLYAATRLPGFHAELRSAERQGLPVVTLRGRWQGRALTVHAVHAPPPSSAGHLELRNETYRTLARWAREDAGDTVVAGDLNAAPWSPDLGRLLRDSGLRDTRRGRGIFPTWPVGFLPLALPLDYCLLGSGLAAASFRVLEDVGSDHYPILVELGRARGP
ncbi:MAG: endonuclease/exonuclease/phosphatase family protein [Planctomycetes bacterium]|nr:endonuclease/exonuclease/phosphatase family protein [Planctomycetota bacterium]